MAATFSILQNRVGDGAKQRGTEVKRLQILLKLAGFNVGASGADGAWGDDTRDALIEAFAKLDPDTKRTTRIPGVGPKRWSTALDPDDPFLVKLAWKAGCLIPLPGRTTGEKAFLDIHRWLVQDPRTEFSWTVAIWGLKGHPEYAIATTWDTAGGPHYPCYARLNCSLYANLMMSAWRQGNCHAAPFDASIAMAGRTNFAKYRYGYSVLTTGNGKSASKLFSSADQIRAAVKAAGPDGLYCLEKSSSKGVIGHMAMLLKDRVYECNVSPVDGCNDMPLETWFSEGRYCFVSGPSRP